MSELFRSPFLLVGLLGIAFAVSSFLHRKWGQIAFGILHPTSCFLIFYLASQEGFHLFFISYVVIALVVFGFLHFPRQVQFWAVTIFLISLMVASRILPDRFTYADYAVALGSWSVPWIAGSGLTTVGSLIGFSYFCFRLILLAIEVRQSPNHRPTIFQFLGFAFFLPHFVVGPITPFAYFQTAFVEKRNRDPGSLFRVIVRIVLGLTKFFFLSGLFYQMTLSRTWTMAIPVDWSHVIISAFAYTFFIYLNFSGFVDVMIGASYLCGIESKENFDSPWMATSLRDFWKRWHISLTDFLQITIFNPLLKKLSERRWPFAISISLGTLAVFIVMGLWHGFQWNYMIFSLLHALGLIVTYFWPRSWKVPAVAGWLLTFCYITFCFVFFENSTERLLQLWQYVR